MHVPLLSQCSPRLTTAGVHLPPVVSESICTDILPPRVHTGLSLLELCNPAGFRKKMWAMEGGMPSTRPNRLLPLWPAYATTLGVICLTRARPNQFNQSSSRLAFLNWTLYTICGNGTKCTLRFRWYWSFCGINRRHEAGMLWYECTIKVLFSVSSHVINDSSSLGLFPQMRPSVITSVSSLRNPSCRPEVHRGHSSGQSHTPVNELIHQTVPP